MRSVPAVFRCTLGTAAAMLVACRPASPQLPSPDLLSADVTIRRDEFGIPHILAGTEEAAAFGFGYAQAEDHAAEIGRRYLSARGEEARYFGVSRLANDAGMAQFDNLAEAQRALAIIPPLYHRIISAYAAGVNRYVQRHPSSVPEWMPELTAADVLAHTRASAVDALAGPTLPRLLREKYEARERAGPTVAPDEWSDAPGSNALLSRVHGRPPASQSSSAILT